MKRGHTIIPTLSLLLLGSAAVLGQGDFEKGISYYKQGQYARAIEEFEQIVQAEPGYEAGYRVLGDCYLKTRDYRRASEAFEKAIQLDDSNFASYLGAAMARFNLGDYEKSVDTLRQGERVARSPRERYQLHQLRGSAYYRLGRYRETIADLEQAVGIQRGQFNDALQLGVAHFQLGNLESARRYLEQAEAIRPGESEASRFLARLSFREAVSAIEGKRYARAEQLLTVYVEKNPQDAEAWYNLGLAQLFSDQLDKAEASFRKAIALAPQNWQAHNRLGYVYEMRKRYPAALSSYRKALELHSDSSISESVERIEERIRREQESG